MLVIELFPFSGCIRTELAPLHHGADSLSHLDEAQGRADAALHAVLAGLGALLPSRGTARDPKDVSVRLHKWLAAHSPTWALLDPDTGKEAGADAKPLGEGSFGMVFLARRAPQPGAESPARQREGGVAPGGVRQGFHDFQGH